MSLHAPPQLAEWLTEWPSVRARTEELVLSLKRRQLTGSYDTAKRATKLLSEMVTDVSLDGAFDG